MKKKVKFGRDLDKRPIKEAASLEAMEPFSQKGRVSYNSADSRGEENEDGLSKKETKQHDAVASSSTRNLTIRLKIPKGAHLGEGDSEKEGRPSPDATLLYMNIREISRSDCSKKHEATSMDSSVPTCQIEGCTADLSCANSYFRRNKVCQSHFKATKVEVGNSEQRFCQQCNRFHVVAEFDEGKRSCRLTLAGHNNRRKRSQPEATSVLSSGTLVYLPGKVRRGEKSAMHADPFTCEDLERTVTNEETSDTDNNLRDDASSGNLHKEKSCRSWGRLDPIARQSKLMSCKYTEIPGKARLEQLGQAHSKGEGALLEPMSNAATSFYKNQCIKNSGGNKKKNISSHVTSINMCQVEGCMINLSNTKDYFRRRKVCERHFKATKVKVKNVEQRFCQQCSRFHVLAEFDEGRKSCKKMLMGHNMRRRKAQPETMSRMRSKNSRKDDYDNLKGPQAHIQKKQPMVDSGFETSKEENQPL